MSLKDITSQIIGAWDEEQPKAEEEAEAAPEEPVEEPVEEAESEEESEPDVEEDEEPAEGEEAGEEVEEGEGERDGEEEAEEEPEPEVAASFQTEDPEAKAFLAKYQGDVERALKGGVQMQQAVSRIGREREVLEQRVQQLEAQLAQAQALEGRGAYLSEEQREWVSEAAGSGQPASYVQMAIRAGEYDLARAVCDEWASEDPYNAMRVSQVIDSAEYQASQQNGAAMVVDHNQLMGILVENFPEMPQYEAQMVETLGKLGEEHPLALQARSQDPTVAGPAIISLYEIARASSASVAQARAKAKDKSRRSAQEARDRAVVSSSQTTAQPGQSPSPSRIAPGLTLEALDAEWGR